MSGDAVQALGSGVTLDSPLVKAHAYGAAVVNPLATTARSGKSASALRGLSATRAPAFSRDRSPRHTARPKATRMWRRSWDKIRTWQRIPRR